MEDNKVVRVQQEILKINGKIISIEAGTIVNDYDLTTREYIEVSKFINNTIHNYVNNKLLKSLNK